MPCIACPETTDRCTPWKHAPAGVSKKKPLVRCQKNLMTRFELRISSGVHRPAEAESPLR